jgi:hypothetical protein
MTAAALTVGYIHASKVHTDVEERVKLGEVPGGNAMTGRDPPGKYTDPSPAKGPKLEY